METLLGMEERIIFKLFAQLSAERAIIDQHKTIQQMETSLNDIQTRRMAVESTCATMTRENEALKLKVDDLENRSRWNKIFISLYRSCPSLTSYLGFDDNSGIYSMSGLFYSAILNDHNS
ncbi:hypothetical protein ABVT39_022090 [Epinephelus coioides]